LVNSNPTLHQLTSMARQWFPDLRDEDRAQLLASARPRCLAAGERLFSRGEPPDGLFGVEEGIVRVSGLSPQGRESVLDFYGKDSWFGEVASLSHLHRLHYADAYVPTRILHVEQHTLDDLIQTSPSIGRAFLRLGSLRLGALLVALEQYSTQTLETRLASRLMMLASTFGSDSAIGVHIDLRLPQETLALLIGSTRQRVNQLLKVWEERGVIQHRYGRILLRDRRSLEALAGESFSA